MSENSKVLDLAQNILAADRDMCDEEERKLWDIYEAEKQRIDELEADNKRLAKYAKGWHDGHKVGMERAAEIVEGRTMKEGNYLWTARVNEYLRYASKAIRKEIDT